MTDTNTNHRWELPWRKGLEHTDAGFAERIGAVIQLGPIPAVYCDALGGWLVYDGTRYARDTLKQMKQIAIQVARDIPKEITPGMNSELKDAKMEFSRSCQGRNKIVAALDLASTIPEVVMYADAFDADLWAMNCLNGTLDLKTGELREHSPEDYITKRAETVWRDLDYCDDRYKVFLDDATQNDPEVKAFIQRAAGATLPGVNFDEVMFLIHGGAGTGKSTFVGGMQNALGDYAMTADFETFIKKRGDSGVRNDIARTRGKRAVFSNEVEDGKTLAEAVIKSMTGGDIITARFLYREYFEFTPQFLIWLVCNHAPHVHADDDAMWRRILRVPFDYKVPQDKRDNSLKEYLLNDPGARSAILAWAVRGCLAWQRDGLNPPEAIIEATQAYREGEDPLGDWIEERIMFDRNARTPTAILYGDYEQHAHLRGLTPLTNKPFVACLKRHEGVSGSESVRFEGRKMRCITGVRFKSDTEARADGSDQLAIGGPNL